MSVARWFHHLLFSQAAPLIRLGRHRLVTPADMPALPRDIDPRTPRVSRFRPDARGALALLVSQLRLCGRALPIALLLMCVRVGCVLLIPFIVRDLVASLVDGKSIGSFPMILALALGALGIAQGLLQQHCFYLNLKNRQRLEAGLNLAIFRHSLRLSLEEKGRTPTGDIVNHMSADTQSAINAPMIVTEGFEIFGLGLGGTCVLYGLLGPAALMGPLILLLTSPLTRKLGRRFVALDEEVMKHSDARNSRLAQVIGGIRVVKSFHWTEAVGGEVSTLRGREVAARRRLVWLRSFSGLVFLAINVSLCLVSFWVAIVMGRELDAATVFAALAVMVSLEEPFGAITHFIAWAASAKVGAGRVAEFLRRGVSHNSDGVVSPGQATLNVKGVALGYREGVSQVVSGLSFSLNPGESCAVVGAVGSGKSTLISAILGEMEPTQGSVQFVRDGTVVRPRMAYVPQEAFVMNGTVRENIAFGRELTDAAVAQAVERANFEGDVVQMPAGLRSEIGERGLNLSGGQRQRLSLARAAAADADVVILDDPLSAVDPETEMQLLDRLIFGKWSGVTRIVATHKLAALPRFDRILFLKGDGHWQFGTWQELMERSADFRVLQHHAAEAAGAAPAVAAATAGQASVEQCASGGERLVCEEDKEVGAVRASVYGEYLRALGSRGRLGWLPVAFMFLSVCCVNLFPLVQKAWMAWCMDAGSQGVWGWSGAQAMVAGYGLLSLMFFAVTFGDELLWGLRSLSAGKHLHDDALTGVLQSPLRFFDTNPAGRIMNRFSRDVEAVDGEIGWSFGHFAGVAVKLVLTLVSTVLALPVVLVVMAPILVAYYCIQRDYRAVAREVKRFEATARSPRFAHFKETLAGITTIRGFCSETVFVESFLDKLSEGLRMSHASVLVNRWFSARMPMLGGVMSGGVALAVVLSVRSGSLSPGVGGLVLTWALAVESALNWSVRAFSELEANMTSVERLRSYARLMPEPDVLGEVESHALVDWPRKGNIEFRDVYARYSHDLPYVLKGVSFSVDGGQRVGIVGKSGSGKSTLLQALFRFIQVSRGEVSIDGVDIACVPLGILRRAVAIIPQDPVLFVGTLRDNLDRFQKFSDGQIWAALSKAHMREAVESLGGLGFEVRENGLNFSQGQRQLLCLARALLLKARIVVMDEPTANVDVRTDALIQRTIREECVGMTVLVIAHRMNTVADCDKIVDMNLCYAG